MTAAFQHRTTGPAHLSGSRFASCRHAQRFRNTRPAKRAAGRKTASRIFFRAPSKPRRELLPQVTGTHLESRSYRYVFAPGCVVAPNSAALTFNSQLGPLPSLTITPSTTVLVYVWDADTSHTSPGHVMVTDPRGNVILSQFPRNAAGSRDGPGSIIRDANKNDNTTLDSIQTFQTEGRAPDGVYQVNVPNAGNFFSAAVDQRMRPDWVMRASGATETNCVVSGWSALSAGGVPLPANSGFIWPGTLNDTLQNMSKNPNNGVQLKSHWPP